jgi:hypothetical protein
MFLPQEITSASDIYREIAESVDRLITVDLPFRAVARKLYADARQKKGAPLTLLAAEILRDSVGRQQTVLIATGWPDRPHIGPQIAETDGPPGAVSLGMALHRSNLAVPIFLIEEQLVEAMEVVATAAGFKTLTPDEALAAADSRAPLHAAAVQRFPIDDSEAREVSKKLLDGLAPQAVVVIEKGGMNDKGVIHTSRGDDTTTHMAKVDRLVQLASKRAIPTIGIGDGGNEIGMGVIADELRRWLPYGNRCRCGCGSGIVPVTQTDLLVPAAVSNWGAYGIAAMLALMTGNEEVLHTPAMEQRILESCIRAGFIDGGSGYVNGGADALPMEIHVSITALLRELVHKGLELASTLT